MPGKDLYACIFTGDVVCQIFFAGDVFAGYYMGVGIFKIPPGMWSFLLRNGLSNEMMTGVAETGRGFPRWHNFLPGISPVGFFSPGWKPPRHLAGT